MKAETVDRVLINTILDISQVFILKWMDKITSVCRNQTVLLGNEKNVKFIQSKV